MEMLIIAIVMAAVVVGVALVLTARDRGAKQAAEAVESTYGPLPEGESERAEVTDPAQFGQVTPGAVTPAAAGSPEAFYESTGVGEGGPRHLSGPPPVAAGAGTEEQRRPIHAAGPADRTDQADHPTATGGWSDDAVPDWEQEGGRSPLPYVAAAGAGLGLAVFGALRWRARRRRTRLERVRDRARLAARLAGDRTSALTENLDRSTTTGSGVALATVLVLFGALRQWREGRRQAGEAKAALLAAEAAAAAAAERRAGRLRARVGATWQALKTRRTVVQETVEAHAPSPDGGSRMPVALLVSGLGASAAVVAALRKRQQRIDWSGADVGDAAPAR